MGRIRTRVERLEQLGSGGKRFPFTFGDSTQSTKYDATTKLIVGSKSFDPNDTAWGLSGTSTVVLHVLLGITNASNTAQADLYQQTGTGSPTVVGTTASTNSLTAAELTVNVSTAFRPGANAGIFNVRCWVSTFNGNDQTTCYGAWLEITP